MPVVPNRMKALPRPRWWLQGRPAADPIDERSMARRVAAGRISNLRSDDPGRWYPQGFKHGTAVLGQSLVTQGNFRIHGLLDDAPDGSRFSIRQPTISKNKVLKPAQSAKCPANGNSRITEKNGNEARHRRPAEPGLSNKPTCSTSLSQLIFNDTPNHNPSIVSKRGFQPANIKVSLKKSRKSDRKYRAHYTTR